METELLNYQVPEEVLRRTADWRVRSASIFKGKRLQATSKFHNFRPAITLDAALRFLKEAEAMDAAIIFTNQCGITFEKGLFKEFEDFESEMEDEQTSTLA